VELVVEQEVELLEVISPTSSPRIQQLPQHQRPQQLAELELHLQLELELLVKRLSTLSQH
jgi:regulator of replication initiation timing